MLLMYHLYVRLQAIWQARNLPSYLGPSTGAMAHLFILTLITILLLFALTILLVTAANSLLTNTTMIETWEIERHSALLERSRFLGGYVQGPGGRRVQIVKQEFPYDIGFWRNLVQGMGSKNILAWFLPIGGGPDNRTAWGPWENNGFEDPNVQWPPADPEKLGWEADWKKKREDSPFVHPASDEDRVQAFRRRQEADYRRWERSRSGNSSNPRASQAGSREYLHENSADEVEYESEDDSGGQGEYEEGIDGYPGWTSSDGSRLRDFGVDEEAEVIIVGDEEDDDDVPLGVLLRRRRAQASAATSTGE
jgi:palmitoyltransferase